MASIVLRTAGMLTSPNRMHVVAAALALAGASHAATFKVLRMTPGPVLAVTDAANDRESTRRVTGAVERLRAKLGPGLAIEVLRVREADDLGELLRRAAGRSMVPETSKFTEGFERRAVGRWRRLDGRLTEIWRDRVADEARSERLRAKVQAIGREGLAKYPPAGVRALGAMETVRRALADAPAPGSFRAVALVVHRAGGVTWAVSGPADAATRAWEARLAARLPAHWARAAPAADTTELTPIDMGDGDVHAGSADCAEPRVFAATLANADQVDEFALFAASDAASFYALAPGDRRLVPCPSCAHFADRIRKREVAARR